MLEFTVSYNTTTVKRALDRLPRDVADLNRVALGQVAEQVLRQAETQYFRPGGDEAGPNLQSGPGSLRRVTGKLAQSLTKELRGDYLAVVGATVRYAQIHEKGGTIGPRTYPARPYLAPALEDVFETGTAQKIFESAFIELGRRFSR